MSPKTPSVSLTLAALVVGALGAGGAGADPAAPAVANPNAQEAKALIQQFAGTLKGELQAAMKSGGPVAAVKVCKERAPAIASDIAKRSGWTVKRTSLKVRNPALDTPDAWELEVLTRFDQRKAAGEPVDTLAYSAVVDDGGVKTFRFMKAIPTAGLCLTCHGTHLTPEVAAALDAEYPGDQARGYAEGDIRGAFSVSKAEM